MSRGEPARASEGLSAVDTDRRAAVLRTALHTFARYGFRRTSMDQIARDADISRPGLYFLFDSKQALFREAVDKCLREDLAEIETILAGSRASLRTRLIQAFDTWAGRYVGPLSRDISAVVDDNPDLHGPTARTAPATFAALITAALETQYTPAAAGRIAQTLISTSIGIKHQVDERDQYVRRLTVAVDLLLPRSSRPRRQVPTVPAPARGRRGSP